MCNYTYVRPISSFFPVLEDAEFFSPLFRTVGLRVISVTGNQPTSYYY